MSSTLLAAPTEVSVNQPLQRLNTWQLPATAQYYAAPKSVAMLQAIVSWARSHQYPITLLGLGSNLLLASEVVRGIVIHTRHLSDWAFESDTKLRLAAGVTCAKFAKICEQKGFNLGAFWAGIPGTVGGAVRMNAGAFGEETATTLASIQVITETNELKWLPAECFEFGYRTAKGLESFIITQAMFDLSVYQGTADMDIKALLQKRKASQPIGTANAGSVFKNPYPDYAAQLIEASGLKGHVIGGAQISPKHANFIINQGHASAADILALIKLAREEVATRFGITLELEVKVVNH